MTYELLVIKPSHQDDESLKIYPQILSSSFYVINKYIDIHLRILNPNFLAYSDFALASCAQQCVLLMLH